MALASPCFINIFLGVVIRTHPQGIYIFLLILEQAHRPSSASEISYQEIEIKYMNLQIGTGSQSTIVLMIVEKTV